MKTIREPSKDTWASLCTRGTKPMKDLEPMVREVFNAIAEEGDEALRHYTRKFDNVEVSDLKVSADELSSAEDQVSEELKSAISLAKENIYAFHKVQKVEGAHVETMPGVSCWQTFQPIEKIGLYIPGGTAPLFSTLLMLAIPAAIAGCQEIRICTPPGKDGKIDPVVLYAAKLCGINSIYKVGGIQAIGAMTYGTKTIPAVYKIFGPGNQYVTAAKNYATQLGVAIDMPAGPSELMIIADDSANPEFIAADLLSQAEHGPDSQVILLTPSQNIIERVKSIVSEQLENIPRKEVASQALQHSRAVLFTDKEQIAEFMNEYAPEHLIINTQEDTFYKDRVRNAGSVFLGPYTPESAGDYASGTNHTLPTNGYAKQFSGVTVQAFLKSITFQEITPKGLEAIGPIIETMAAAEKLEGHKNAVSVRLDAIKKSKE
ncbi:MAG: histidinol dehydrogenase [Bacteroidia bacterium]|nr:histidinol dehydrogenase [Bacteroidia bacterium]